MRNIVRSWPPLILSYLGLAVFGYIDNVRGPLFKNILDEYQLSHSVGSAFFFIPSLIFTFASLLAIRIGQFVGVQRLFPMQLSLALVSQWLFWKAQSFGVLILGGILWGLAFGPLSVWQNLLVLDQTHRAWRSRLISGLHLQYALSSILATFVAERLFDWSKNWKWAFQLSFILVAIVWILSFFLKVDPKVLSFKPNGPLLDWRVIKDARAQRLALILSMAVCAEILISSRFSVWYQTQFGLSGFQASQWLKAFFIAFFLARFLLSFWPITKKVTILLLIFVGLCLVAYIFLYLGYTPALIVYGFSVATFYPLIMHVMKTVVDASDLAAVGSWVIFVSGLSLVLMNILMGILADILSLHVAMLLGLIFLGLLGISLWHLKSYELERV